MRRPGKTNGGNAPLCIFMVLCALAVAFLGYQVGELARSIPAKADPHAHLRHPVERGA